jgi:phosphatidylserine decarboxylase
VPPRTPHPATMGPGAASYDNPPIERHPLIAREGWAFVGISLALAAAMTYLAGWAWALPLWLASLFILQFFRDPHRRIPDAPGLVVVPADGRVIAVENARDPWLDRDALKISVFMNVFNVQSNRAPVAGEVKQVSYRPGGFINAAFDKASSENERNALCIRTEEGVDVTCVQIAGLIARRILCYVESGSRLARGQRFGFIRFGSRVDTFLPIKARPAVRLGDRVRAGSDVLAFLE